MAVLDRRTGEGFAPPFSNPNIGIYNFVGLVGCREGLGRLAHRLAWIYGDSLSLTCLDTGSKNLQCALIQVGLGAPETTGWVAINTHPNKTPLTRDMELLKPPFFPQ